jgi:V/A-type H+-transporting ATPase subunit C
LPTSTIILRRQLSRFVLNEDTETDTEFLKNCIRQGNYNLLPKGMEQAAKDATTVLMQTGDGQLCDVIIDRATLEAIKQAGQEATNESGHYYAFARMIRAITMLRKMCSYK